MSSGIYFTITHSTGEANHGPQSCTGKRVLLGILDYLIVLVDDDTFCNQGRAKFAHRLMNLCHFNSPDVAKKASDVVHLYAQKGEEELSHRTSKSTLPILLCNLVSLDVRMRTVYHS